MFEIFMQLDNHASPTELDQIKLEIERYFAVRGVKPESVSCEPGSINILIRLFAENIFEGFAQGVGGIVAAFVIAKIGKKSWDLFQGYRNSKGTVLKSPTDIQLREHEKPMKNEDGVISFESEAELIGSIEESVSEFLDNVFRFEDNFSGWQELPSLSKAIGRSENSKMWITHERANDKIFFIEAVDDRIVTRSVHQKIYKIASKK